MADTIESLAGFALTRQWCDTEQGIELRFWLATERGPVLVRVPDQEAVFFIPAAEEARLAPLLGLARGWRSQRLSLLSPDQQPVMGLYFKQYKRARDAAQILRRHMPVWEADVRPPERFLMERFLRSSMQVAGVLTQHVSHRELINPKFAAKRWAPNLRVVSVDIETDMQARMLYSIAVSSGQVERVFMVAEEPPSEACAEFSVEYFANERGCLEAFFDWLGDYDPDVLIGWNVVGFDLWVMAQMCRRLAIPYRLGRLNQEPSWRSDPDDPDARYITIPGRVVLDGIELLRAAFYHFDSFALEFVAREVLGEGKLLSGGDRGASITELFESDKLQLARYNLKDCQLVWDIFEQRQLLSFALAKSQLTGLALDRFGGSAASFEFSYMPRLHRKGYVAPNIGEVQVPVVAPGGFVLESCPGLFRQVLVFDFKSLYPSIIRTFQIDPYGFWRAEHQALSEAERVPGFNQASFARAGAILPELIADLWRERDVAKREQNQPLSQAIKIIMNSFYGVLGSSLCRFYDPRVASSITLRGHEILQQTQAWFEARGHRVIYGDTDSVFVWLGDDYPERDCRGEGKALAVALNDYWRDRLEREFAVQSFLEIQFETHYSRFYMPKIRGQETGSKKRYAGWVVDDHGCELVLRGLEAVRSDWTALAREFQRQVFQRVFEGREYRPYIVNQAQALMAGELDDQLVYRKRLRRPLADYEAISPPHVQAARKLEAGGEKVKKGDWVEYVITLQGAQPVALLGDGILDYQHYLEKQMAPVVDGLLHELGDDFAQLTNQQIQLF